MQRDRTRRVLIVEDEIKLLSFLTLLLESAGFEVVGAIDGPGALDELGKATFGVAIIDKNLSVDMNGLDVLRKAREIQPNLQGLIHTGYPSTESAVEALQAGAFDYIQKPTDNDLLVAQVERAWLTYELRTSRDELFRNYETLFELIPGIVWFTTDGGVFRRVSRKGAGLLEYEPADLIGQRFEFLLDPNANPDDADWAFKERRGTDRTPGRHLVTLRTRSGQKRVFEMSSCAAYANAHSEKTKKYQGTLAVGWDVTENLRLFDELLQAKQMDALGRLAGGIAHDFNSLLTAILTSASMAADTEGDDTRVHLASITDAAEAAAEKTRALLAFHRDTTKTTEKTDIAAVVETVHKALPKLLGDTVHVEISVEPNLWPVMADPEQVERVLVNLVLNARDAMPDGGPLHIRAYNQVASRDAADTASEYAVLQVDDKGTGMTPEVRERVFDPFFTTKPLGEGTGLGMAMVYGVAQRAGGHVEITTEVDKGTSVRVYLPQYTKALKIQSDPAIPVAKEGKETVLLVEDNRLLRIVAARILKAAGYQVAEAGDTESALRVWKQAPDIDAVLTDVIMPGRSGIELADELRTMSPELPIVFMSGHIGSLEHAMKPRDDSTAFIEKPFKADDVLREIRRVIDKRSPAL